MMLKKIKVLATAALSLGLASFSSVALAINPGTYYCTIDNVEEGMYGSLVIYHLEDREQRTEPLDLFSLITYDGVESQHHYAGVINLNTPEEARATVMLSLDKGEHNAAVFDNKFTSGTWLAPLSSTRNTICITKKGNKLFLEGYNGEKPIEAPNAHHGYRFLSADFSRDVSVALKLVALNKIRALRGLAPAIEKQSFTAGYSGTLHWITLKENGIQTDYAVPDDLSYFNQCYNNANKNQELFASVQKELIFGNAAITGDDVLVRFEPNTKAEIRGVVNKGDRFKLVKYVTGEKIDAEHSWTWGWLPNGESGYIFGKYVKAD